MNVEGVKNLLQVILSKHILYEPGTESISQTCYTPTVVKVSN